MQFIQNEKNKAFEHCEAEKALNMSKSAKGFFALIVALVLSFALFIAPGKAWAESYSLPQTTIRATVTDTGDMIVREQRVIEIKGDTPYIAWSFKDLPSGSTFFVKNISIAKGSAAPESCEITDFSDEGLEAAPEGYRALMNHNFDVRWRSGFSKDTFPIAECYAFDYQTHTMAVFLDEEPGAYTISFTYELTNAVQVYQDVCDLYWKFISSEWPVPAENVSIVAALPKPAGSPYLSDITIRAWSHGSEDATIAAAKTGLVTLTVPSINAGNYAEMRTIFPAEWVTPPNAKSANVHPNTVQAEAIFSQERSWKDNDAYWQTVTYGVILACAISVILVLLLALLSYRRFMNENKSTFTEKYWKDVPMKGVSPAVVSRLIYDGSASNKDFAVSVMELVRKGVVKVEMPDGSPVKPGAAAAIEEGAEGHKGIMNVIFVRNVPKTFNYETDIDRRTVDLLFDVYGQGDDRVSLARVKAEGYKKSVQKALESWHASLNARCEGEGIFELYRTIRWPRLVAIALVAIIVEVVAFLISGYHAVLIPGTCAVLLAALALLPLGRASKVGEDTLARTKALGAWFTDLAGSESADAADSEKNWPELYEYAFLMNQGDELVAALEKAAPEGVEGADIIAAQQACANLEKVTNWY